MYKTIQSAFHKKIKALQRGAEKKEKHYISSAFRIEIEKYFFLPPVGEIQKCTIPLYIFFSYCPAEERKICQSFERRYFGELQKILV